jgi:acyl phosphate:glycerol-3-phosphate acyltransferase
MYQLVVVLTLLAYAVGSIPFSQLITTWRTGQHLRDIGEGNVGSRNVWHVVGPSWGVLAATLDALKGFVVFAVAQTARLPLVGVLMCGLAVLIGHQFPVFLNGRGGKGVATAFGFLLGVSTLSTVCGLVILGLAYLAFRDFNPAVACGIVAMILLPFAFRQPLWVPLYELTVFLLLALKKLLDRPHEQHVWANHPWSGSATPGFHPAQGPDTASASDPQLH